MVTEKVSGHSDKSYWGVEELQKHGDPPKKLLGFTLRKRY